MFGWWCAATTLLSAWLLFQVQPLMSKAILPWFGGTPAVWSTCMLFFQMLLLGGYTYAHLLRKIGSAKSQAILHCILLVCAVVILPIVPSESWKPSELDNPAVYILLLLAANVGLPYFVLSSTGPLVQSWFATKLPGRSPYRLYALSNVGSLAALLTYPFIVEPALTVNQQGNGWSLLFAAFAVLSGYLAITIARIKASSETNDAGSQGQTGDEGADRVTRDQWFAWIALPCLASILLLAFTNFVCQDVAVVPFLWVAPLSLYLLTFIICFDGEWWYRRFWFGLAGLVSIVFVTFTTYRWDVERIVNRVLKHLELPGKLDYSDWTGSIVVQVVVFLSALFFLCMVCHGELVRSKPKPKHLTTFYLCISAGGALGGLFVSFLCPMIFHNYWELPLSIMAASVLVISVVYNEVQSWGSWRNLVGGDRSSSRVKSEKEMLSFTLILRVLLVTWGTVAVTTFVFIVVGQQDLILTEDIESKRNFYGVLRLREFTGDGYELEEHIELYHGRIAHGCQFIDEEMRGTPTSYYTVDSGVGIAVTTQQGYSNSVKVGVIGLGAGTMAAYCREHDEFTFYEINPLVKEIADEYFHFLSDAPNTNVIFGDARNSLEAETESLQYDVLVVDAFSGDAIPAHLVTDEAFAIYKRHIKPTGVICVHISNRYLDLFDIVAHAAKAHGLDYCLADKHSLSLLDDGSRSSTEATSDWLLLSADVHFMGDMKRLSGENHQNMEIVIRPTLPSTMSDAGKENLAEAAAIFKRTLREPRPDRRMWTDQFSNLFEIMK